jgi:hypothetical protein
VLIGQTGVGKTFIAQAIGLHACASGKSVLYMSITALLENLAIARSGATYLRYRDKLAKFDLIIIDEMGMRNLTATEAQDLCEIIEERSIRTLGAHHHYHRRNVSRRQSQETCLEEKGPVELPNRGSAGNPCKVGPFTRNRAGPLREIVHEGQREMARDAKVTEKSAQSVGGFWRDSVGFLRWERHSEHRGGRAPVVQVR